jgi:hypothetical protein
VALFILACYIISMTSLILITPLATPFITWPLQRRSRPDFTAQPVVMVPTVMAALPLKRKFPLENGYSELTYCQINFDP